jgi:hypothetical protein
MYKVEYQNQKLKTIFSNLDTFVDSELEEELQDVLKKLKETGEIAGANCGFQPGVMGILYELQGKTFKLVYTVSSELKIVKIINFYQMSYSIDWQQSLEDLSNVELKKYSIPQIGDHKKYIKAVEYISNGVTTPHDLGLVMGSKANKAKDISRRGYYFSNFLEEIGLVEIVKFDRKVCTYQLTHKGELIARNKDVNTKNRLFAESLLGFVPLQIIIYATTRGEKQLTLELIGDVITEFSQDSCGGTTNIRRAKAVRPLVNWLSRWAGIPICYPGQEGVQLYIPHIYGD